MHLPGIEGRISLVTGAAGGIGAAVAGALAAAGSTVVMADLASGALTGVAAELIGEGHRVESRHLDVSRETSVDDVVSDIEEHVGPIDMLVNVAGVLGGGGSVLDMDVGDWDRTYAVNIRGTFLVCRAVARVMVPRRRGSIVTIASNTTRVVRMNQSAYGSSKAAVQYFTKGLGLELAQYGIRCNVVNPGVTRTPMATQSWTDPARKQAQLVGDLERFRVGIALGRLAEPEDISNAVLFLLSDLASHITTADLLVDGASTLNV